MNTLQLEKAQKDWGFAMDIKLENNKLFVANDGYITDDPTGIKKSKHAGELNGFYYFSKRKQNANVLRNVIASIVEDGQLVTA